LAFFKEKLKELEIAKFKVPSMNEMNPEFVDTLYIAMKNTVD